MSEEPANREESGRNPDGTFKAGFSGNPSGRPKNTLKDYVSKKFQEMSDAEKEEWLKENKVSGEFIWRMGEGNPAQQTDITSAGQPIPILGGITHVYTDNSSKENIEPEKEA